MTEVIVSLVHDGFGLGEDDAEELGWQDRALCAQTDPEAFFPRRAGPPGKPRRCAAAARSGPSAWNTRLSR